MMNKIPVIAIFDVGKTNKKLLLFNEQYQVVYENSTQLDETLDEDGFACEDVQALTQWTKDSFEKIGKEKKFKIKAVNFSAYGASFVYLDEKLNVIPPLYNYLKPYSLELQNKFYKDYGGGTVVATETASPVLGNLNSGMQLYRLRYEQNEKFKKIKWALHLPEYLSYVFSSSLHSQITSIGCHTNLWNFQKHNYHQWVMQEEIQSKLPRIIGCNEVAGQYINSLPVGVGLHDSSSALIPYQASFQEPFILLSTGTWCVSLNPFNQSQLTEEELNHDCLFYLSFDGKPVKASRLFAGHEHDQQVKKLSEYFNKPHDYFTSIAFNPETINKLNRGENGLRELDMNELDGITLFSKRMMDYFPDYETAYHQLMADIVREQIRSTRLVLNGTDVKRIFVDGGFSKNAIYMHLLAEAFSGIEVYAASVAQASALGAALVMHDHWNTKEKPANIIELKMFSDTRDLIK